MIIREARGQFYIGDGELAIDLISGIQNVPLGHGHDVVKDVIRAVANQGLINSYNIQSSAREELERSLCNHFPQFAWQICSSGTEAIERILQLIKLKRGDQWVGRVLYLNGAFHGKSFAVARARYGDKWGSDLFVPLTDITQDEPFDAIIYEPIQGLTGRQMYEGSLARLCEKAGAYLIADEMITGFGRCGPDFMSRAAHYVACGKGISSGLPITFIASRLGIEEIPTGWTTTAAGNALCCAVAAATLEYLKSNPPDTLRFEATLRAKFEGAVWGKGALLFIRVKDVAEAKRRLVRKGMIALYTDDSVRLAPFLYWDQAGWEGVVTSLYQLLGDLL